MGALGTHRAASSGDGYQSEGPTQPIRPTRPIRLTQPTRPTRPTRPRRRSRIAVRMAKILFAVVLVVAAAVGLLFALTPSAGQATALTRAQAQDRHIAYPGPAVPPYFAQALIATEDHRFSTDPGVDPVALGRVAINWILGRQDQGGSTIDQQLAKNLYTGGHSGFAEDLEQLAMAVKLNQAYSRAEILRMYAEVAYFGHGYYGLAAASCGYFGVTPAGLSWPQAAMLAGVVQAPSADNPIAHLAVARAREAHVLGRLATTGKLTQAQASRAYRQPLHLIGGPSTGCTAR